MAYDDPRIYGVHRGTGRDMDRVQPDPVHRLRVADRHGDDDQFKASPPTATAKALRMIKLDNDLLWPRCALLGRVLLPMLDQDP